VSKREDDFYRGLVGEEKQTAAPAPTAPAAFSEPPLKPVTSKNLFSNPDTHPYVLDLALLRQFQFGWFGWLPETLFFEIEQTFKTSIAEVNRLKILAVQSMHVTDAFWEQWEIFEKTLGALNGTVPRLDVMQPPDASFLLAGVDMANAIRKEEFSDEIGRYVAACLLFEHITYAPPPLEFAKEFLAAPYYVCKDCGKKGSALPPFDGTCDSCTGKFRGEHPFAFKPDPILLAQGHGKDLLMGLTYDPDPVKKRFDELNQMPANKLAGAIREVPEDIEAAKLIVAVDYQKYRDQQLQEQLTALGPWLGAQA
jgi:hypothetical protein